MQHRPLTVRRRTFPHNCANSGSGGHRATHPRMDEGHAPSSTTWGTAHNRAGGAPPVAEDVAPPRMGGSAQGLPRRPARLARRREKRERDAGEGRISAPHRLTDGATAQPSLPCYRHPYCHASCAGRTPHALLPSLRRPASLKNAGDQIVSAGAESSDGTGVRPALQGDIHDMSLVHSARLAGR